MPPVSVQSNLHCSVPFNKATLSHGQDQRNWMSRNVSLSQQLLLRVTWTNSDATKTLRNCKHRHPMLFPKTHFANVPCCSDPHSSQHLTKFWCSTNIEESRCAFAQFAMNLQMSCFQTKLHENMFQFRADFLKQFLVWDGQFAKCNFFGLVVATPDTMVNTPLRSLIAHYNTGATNS